MPNAREGDRLLEGDVCIVTGGAGGLGTAMAQVFLDAGGRVVIADVDQVAAQRVARQLGSDQYVVGVGVDVTSLVAMRRLVETASDHYGVPTVFVNNAGFTRDATLHKMSEDDFDQVIAVHLKGTWLGTKVAADAMRSARLPGSIVNISSISGKVGLRGQSNYAAAKAGIVGLTKSAAKELAFAGIRVNAIQPGIVETKMTEPLRPDIVAQKLAEVPLGRFAAPKEIANVALFLASSMASYVTGEVIEVTGGRYM